MKKLLLLLTILVFTSAASAVNTERPGWFNQRAYCSVNAGVSAVCEVCNITSSRPMFCRMQVRGQTYRGFWFDGWQQGWVKSGRCMKGFVYANNPRIDPLWDARASVQCRF